MAKLIIDGREVIIAPYKIGAMRRASPWIDKINVRVSDYVDSTTAAIEEAQATGKPPATKVTFTEMTEMVGEFLQVLAIGTSAVDPTMDADFLEEHFGIADLGTVRDCFRELMAESGLTPKGEAKAPPARKPRGASKKG